MSADPRFLAALHDYAALEPSARVGDAWQAIAAVDDPELRPARERMRSLLAERPAPLDRGERPGHLTGSAFVVDAAVERTLLLFHTKLQIWVQPGGHADGDANLPAVALREAHEETGIDGLAVWPVAVDLDIHEVDPPKEDAHLHYDVRFLVVAPNEAVVAANHESQDQRWVTEAEIPDLGADDGLQRMAASGFRLARQLAS
ncbi:MAG: NUDIX hydrolase [Acidimicrobiales bacterium]|nr:NUDIX hydrolase [Acidimicrobiales bacterium]